MDREDLLRQIPWVNRFDPAQLCEVLKQRRAVRIFLNEEMSTHLLRRLSYDVLLALAPHLVRYAKVANTEDVLFAFLVAIRLDRCPIQLCIDGTWIEVEPIARSIIVCVGDALPEYHKAYRACSYRWSDEHARELPVALEPDPSSLMPNGQLVRERKRTILQRID